MFSKDGNTKDVKTPRICDVVWHDGEFIKWNDARVHVMSHVLHYGSSVFEGIRCYHTKHFSTPPRFIAWTTSGLSINCATQPAN